jgi:DNA-binding XRE family transcriptional regulator
MTPAEYKATRERLGTQAEVAAMLGVNRVTVAKRESGTMTLTNEAVLAIQSLRRPRRKRKSENVKTVATEGAGESPTEAAQPSNQD